MGVAPGFDAEFSGDAARALFLLAALDLLELDAVEGDALRVVAAFDRSRTFLLVAAGEVFRLLALAFLFDSGTVTGREISPDEFDATDGRPPGTVKTISSLFARCSQCAVAPGSSLKETTVKSPLRWAFTSANPRPRRASACSTSAAGILT